MRVLHAALATLAIASIGPLAGCSQRGSTVSQTYTLNTGRDHAPTRNSGIAPQHPSVPWVGGHQPLPGPDIVYQARRLAVSDIANGYVKTFNEDFKNKQTIVTGLNAPDGDWYDEKGRLYVANFGGVDVAEYNEYGTSPSFTYTAGLVDPVSVTTDASDNVYVGDYSSGGHGYIVEYTQGVNFVMRTCSPGGAVEGVAVGKNGDVFVAYNDPNTGVGHIAKYPNGLAGCNERVLGVTIGFAGGMQVTSDRTLIVCDQYGSVDVIPPPYTAISKSYTGYSDPFHVALDKPARHKGVGLMFVADIADGIVIVQDYPSGAGVTTLGAAQGLSEPAGVAYFP